MRYINHAVTAQRGSPAKHSLSDTQHPTCIVFGKALIQISDSAVSQGRKNNVEKMFGGIIAKQALLDALNRCMNNKATSILARIMVALFSWHATLM